jgi:uncharacterized YkwD family protein/spore coat assembly protein SafA
MRKLFSVFFLLSLLLLIPKYADAQPTTETYIVKQGDTLWKIAVKYQMGVSEIIAANPQLKNPSLLYPGQKIFVPLLTQIKAIEYEVIKLVNQERAKYGLRPLKPNWELSRVARFKSSDMRDHNYFSHQSPIYSSRISFTAAGENIAAGQSTAWKVMQSWMQSPGHRQNILNSGFTEIGVGYSAGGTYRYYWTQMFIKP